MHMPILLQPLRRPQLPTQPPQTYCRISPSLVKFAIYCKGIYELSDYTQEKALLLTREPLINHQHNHIDNPTQLPTPPALRAGCTVHPTSKWRVKITLTSLISLPMQTLRKMHKKTTLSHLTSLPNHLPKEDSVPPYQDATITDWSCITTSQPPSSMHVPGLNDSWLTLSSGLLPSPLVAKVAIYVIGHGYGPRLHKKLTEILRGKTA
ncbi:hypothetical protein BGX38DRAFT_95022 [Terfezia claveryi]|nr:hypothetical protein BGX38DRAFT_95022 [Terfezia claveryi]